MTTPIWQAKVFRCVYAEEALVLSFHWPIEVTVWVTEEHEYPRLAIIQMINKKTNGNEPPVLVTLAEDEGPADVVKKAIALFAAWQKEFK